MAPLSAGKLHIAQNDVNQGGTAERFTPSSLMFEKGRRRFLFIVPILYRFERNDYAMKQKLEEIRANAARELAEASDSQALESLRVKYLGKKGEVTSILKQMGKLSPEERRSSANWPTRFVRLSKTT